jgi:hypothetical protein
MKLTGPACTEALSEAEEAERREGAEDSAGGVRVERRVRPYREEVEAGVLGLCRTKRVKLNRRGSESWPS